MRLKVPALGAAVRLRQPGDGAEFAGRLLDAINAVRHLRLFSVPDPENGAIKVVKTRGSNILHRMRDEELPAYTVINGNCLILMSNLSVLRKIMSSAGQSPATRLMAPVVIESDIRSTADIVVKVLAVYRLLTMFDSKPVLFGHAEEVARIMQSAKAIPGRLQLSAGPATAGEYKADLIWQAGR